MRTARAALTTAAAGLALALFAVVAHADGLVPIPPVARVTDQTGTLSAAQQQALGQKLAALEASKGSQIAVLIVPTTAPEDIEGFSIRVVDAWKLGRKGVDDGVLVTVAKNDRRFRIEVGRGLEGPITDFDSKRIELEELRPKFRAGDYYGGINAAVDRLIGLVNGEALPPPPQPQPQRAMRGGSLRGLFPVVLIIALIGGPILRGLFGRPLGAVASGGVAGFIVWAITATLGFALTAGVLAGLFALLGGLGGGRRFGGGFGGMGGGFGGGFGGGGGGGFSGGGGGFSGGGASGSW